MCASSPSASPSGETDTADLVSEEVEPGVERIEAMVRVTTWRSDTRNFATTWTTST